LQCPEALLNVIVLWSVA